MLSRSILKVKLATRLCKTEVEVFISAIGTVRKLIDTTYA